MRVGIDSVGRIVLPKHMREELGITGPTELEVAARDGVIELAVADVPARVERQEGHPMIVTDEPMPELTVEATRAAIDRTRR